MIAGQAGPLIRQPIQTKLRHWFATHGNKIGRIAITRMGKPVSTPKEKTARSYLAVVLMACARP
jgi:hypothetical protein